MLRPSDDNEDAAETTIDTPDTVPTKPMLKPDTDDAAANSDAPVAVKVDAVMLTALSRTLYVADDVSTTPDATEMETPLMLPVVVS